MQSLTLIYQLLIDKLLADSDGLMEYHNWHKTITSINSTAVSFNVSQSIRCKFNVVVTWYT